MAFAQTLPDARKTGMKALRYIGLLLIVGLLAACGAQKRTVQLPPIQASQQSGSLVAQFGARLTLAGQSRQ